MSASFNQVTLLGNITRDIELRFTPQGTAIADVGLAINRQWKDGNGNKQGETTFVDVTLWSKTAEVAADYCHKGDPLLVSGRLHLDTWDDRQTGQKRSKLKVIGEQIQLLGARRQAKPSAAPPAQQRQTLAAPPKDPDLDAEPDDIPF
jgi:single-strand DNA-binding protein